MGGYPAVCDQPRAYPYRISKAFTGPERHFRGTFAAPARSQERKEGAIQERHDTCRRNASGEQRKEEGLTEGAQNLNQTIREQTMKSAQSFYGNSLGPLKDRLEGDRAQLQEPLDQ